MADPTLHVDALLTDAVDGRLPAGDRQAFDAHLAECDACRRSYEALAWTKEETSRILSTPVPADLLSSLRAALDREDAASAPAPRAALPFKRRRVPGLAVAGVLAAAAIVVLAVALWPSRPLSLPDAIARDLHGVQDGSLALTIESDRPEAVENHLASRLGFRTPVYDLSSMDYRVTGARANRLEGRPSALSAYTGADGDRLICEMFPGSLSEMPAPDERRTAGSVTFLIYRRGPVTIIMWQSGTIVCALAGEAEPGTMLRMAIAKSSA